MVSSSIPLSNSQCFLNRKFTVKYDLETFSTPLDITTEKNFQFGKQKVTAYWFFYPREGSPFNKDRLEGRCLWCNGYRRRKWT